MEYKVDHIPKGKLRPGAITKMEYLTIHSTGGNAPAKNERAWLTNPSNDRIASYHIVVDEKEAIECIPLDEVAWHAGDKEGNYSSIGLEISQGGDRTKTIANAVQLAVRILKERNWGAERLKRHFDWSGKICPSIFAPNGWQGWFDFVKMVDQELKKPLLHQPSDWAVAAWNWAILNKITDGTNPRGPVSREMIATMLYRFREVK